MIGGVRACDGGMGRVGRGESMEMGKGNKFRFATKVRPTEVVDYLLGDWFVISRPCFLERWSKWWSKWWDGRR